MGFDDLLKDKRLAGKDSKIDYKEYSRTLKSLLGHKFDREASKPRLRLLTLVTKKMQEGCQEG